jgi:hypothetical protein
MRTIVAIVVLLVQYENAPARSAYEDTHVICYAKAIDVARLDSALASRGLEEWLQAGPPALTRVQWEVNVNCDLKRRDPSPDRQSLCVKVFFARDDVSGWALIRVGNVAKGIDGDPEFEYAVVLAPDLEKDGTHETVKRLSLLASAIDRHDQ